MKTGKMINTDTIQQEIEHEQLKRMNNTNRETNLYQELIVNNVERIEPLMTQIKQWSILSNVLNYIPHDRHHTINHTLYIKAVNKYRNKSETKEGKKPVDFGSMPLKFCEDYLDVYEDIQSEIVNTMSFDENSDLSTTYLGRSD